MRSGVVGYATLACLVLAGGRSAPSQQEKVAISSDGILAGRYEDRYGKPLWVNLEVLIRGELPAEFRMKAIRTRGIFRAGTQAARSRSRGDAVPGAPPGGRAGAVAGAEGGGIQGPASPYALATLPDALVKGELSIVPVPELADAFESEVYDPRERDMDVVGVLGSGSPTGPAAVVEGRASLIFWSYSAGDAGRLSSKGRKLLPMEDVVRNAGWLSGSIVRFRGQFRGRDLFGEAACSGSPSGGWVVRDGPFSAWVVGRKPEGKGWSLDVQRRSDAERWVEVVGRADVKGECIVIQAREVDLVDASPGSSPP